MKLSSTGLALIKRFEGFSATPYLCPAGYWTIGYGHVISAKEAAEAPAVSEEQAEALLAADVKAAENAVRALIFVPLTQGQFDALVSFTFNLGPARLRASTLRRKLNHRGYKEATAQFARWVYAGGRILPGLIKRRDAEAALFAGGY